MATIKIHCSCGQEYAIEVEPGTNMAFVHVACPACGIDSANPANTLRIQSEQPKPVIAPKPVVRIHIPTPPAAPAPSNPDSDSEDGPAEPPQVEIEARAKIIWGDPAEEVLHYLMIQGYKREAAMDLVKAMVKEREAVLREVGIKKMATGFALILVPVVTFVVFAHLGVLSAKVLGLAGAVGLWGAWIFLNGLLTVLFPKTEKGDIADM